MISLWISLVFVFSISSIDISLKGSNRIVITQDDEDTINRLLKEYGEQWRKYTEEHLTSSSIPLYLDGEPYRNLLKYGLKVVPYLVEGMALTEADYSDYGWIGSALIEDKSVKTPEEVFLYNINPKKESHKKRNTNPLPYSLMPPHRPTLIMQLLPDDMKPKLNIKEGYVDDGKFSWSHWWQQYKDRFIFETKKLLVIKPLEVIHSTMPHISTTVKDGFLHIEAVSATYQQIIERAAAEMNIDIFIGEQEYINGITTVRMKGVTFEEFLYIIGRTICTRGFDYHKTKTGYWVGGKNPAKPRAILDGWGIMMERTVFSVGDEIPVTIITRNPGLVTIINPADPTFVCYGSFRVTMNDGKIVKDYNPIIKSRLDFTVPPIEIKKDGYPIQVFLNKYYKLPAGEYNVRFRYLEHETPSIAIEIYDRKVKRPPLK